MLSDERRAGPLKAGIYFHHQASLGHDPGDHPDTPERITAIEVELAARDWLGFEQRLAPQVDRRALDRVHPATYVDHVREACRRSHALDDDTPVGPASYTAALHAAGAACALVDALLAREAPVGFCGVRPSGHHAERERAMGFCLFNNVAVAAEHSLAAGASRVFVLDWDVHHGNGTNEIFRRRDDVLFASIHQQGLYPGSGPLSDVGSGPGEGFSINLPVPAGSDGELWLSLLEHVVIPAAAEFEPDVVLISAGFDAHRADPLGGCALDAEAFAEMARHVRELGVPVGAVLEGGYDPGALAECVVATLTGLADSRPSTSSAPEWLLTPRAASYIGHYWDL